MKKISDNCRVAIIGLIFLSAFSGCESPSVNKEVAPDGADSALKQTQTIVKAANAFLQSLSADQIKKIQYPFNARLKSAEARFKRSGNNSVVPFDSNDLTKFREQNSHQKNIRRPADANERKDHKPGQPPFGPPGSGGRGAGGPGLGPPGGFVGEQYGAAVWSNYPVSDVLRPGLKLGDMDSAQQMAAMHLLREMLSQDGFKKVMEIIGSDEALAAGGTNFESGRKAYTIALFGTPNSGTPWMVEFGGHHLGLNIVVSGNQGALTPTLTGAQPSIYETGGKTVRVLAAENDKAYDLLAALDSTERRAAILNYVVDDLVLGPGHDGETIVPEGLKASAMTAVQKEMLEDLISQWAGIIHPAYAADRIKEVKSGIDDTYFAWSGPTTHLPGKNGSSYYRIQGPRVIIEFSPQGVGGDPTMHVHTIYRDPVNSYGNGFTKH